MPRLSVLVELVSWFDFAVDPSLLSPVRQLLHVRCVQLATSSSCPLLPAAGRFLRVQFSVMSVVSSAVGLDRRPCIFW